MITVNTLDDVAVPKKGVHGVFAQELAGLGFGNVAFFKTIGKAAGFAELSPHISVGATCAAGFLSKIQMSESAFSNISNEPLAPSPCDRLAEHFLTW